MSVHEIVVLQLYAQFGPWCCGRITGAVADRIELGHETADRIEAKAQEKVKTKQLARPSPKEALDRIESLLLTKQAEGFAAEIVDLEDGR